MINYIIDNMKKQVFLKEGDKMSARKKIVYPTLEAEFSRRGIKKYIVAESLGIKPLTLSKKLGGEIKFTADEAIQIQEQWFSDMTVNELFGKEVKS